MAMKPGMWVMAALIVIVGALLSWPFWVDHGFWAESRGMWVVHVALGCLGGLYVAAMFLNTLATLIYSEAECCKPIEERRKPILEA